jgi:hypothetical protein
VTWATTPVPFALVYFGVDGLTHSLPGLASNCDSPDLSLPNSRIIGASHQYPPQSTILKIKISSLYLPLKKKKKTYMQNLKTTISSLKIKQDEISG